MNPPTPSSGSSNRQGPGLPQGAVPAIPDHKLLKRIGQGSYGEVWLAQNVMGTYRAVKVVYRRTFDDERPYEREYAGIRRFEPISRSHESQVQILHIGRNDQEGHFYYVMELADAAEPRKEDRGSRMDDGVEASSSDAVCPVVDPESYVPRSLQHDLEQRGRLPFGECLSISLGLAGALKHLHERGLVHRDIKPSNIIFVNGIPKLADIGLVTESEATISYVGAQGFMAPEGPGRPRGDLYSLGKVIYEMCTGRDRLDFPALPADFVDWPEREQINELLAISLKACEPEAHKRHASAETLLTDLVMVQAGKSVRRLRALERGRRWASAAVIAGVLVAILALSGLWLFDRVRRREMLLRDAQIQRMREPLQGWAGAALAKLQEAGSIHLDDDIREQAAGAFAGLDARVIGSQEDQGADFMMFDRGGRQLLMDGGAKAGHARLWDTASGEVKAYTTTGRGPVWFGSDGRPRLLHAIKPGVYQVVSLEDGRPLSRFEFPGWAAGSQDKIDSVEVVSPEGSLAAAAVKSVTRTAEGLEQRVDHLGVWSPESGATVWQGAASCSTLAFSPDGHYLAIGTDQGGVQVRALPGWGLVAGFTNDNAAVSSLAFGADPRRDAYSSPTPRWLVASGTAGGTIWIDRLSPPGFEAVCRGATGKVMAVAFAPDGMTLISSGRDGPVAWDVATGRCLLRARTADFQAALCPSPDGRRLAVGMRPGFSSTPGCVRLLELQSNRGISSLRGLSAQAGMVAFSHDGQRLVALAHNWEVGMWNLASNRLEHLLEVPQGVSYDNAGLAFSRDDNLFAFATSEGARIWDARSGAELRSWRLPQGLQQHLWFDTAGHLFLFQWERPAPEKPGECVVRELSRTNYLEPLYPPLHLFDGRIFHSSVAADGRFLVVCGARFTNSFETHVLDVVDSQNGQSLCSLPDPFRGDSDNFCLDASGRLVLCGAAEGHGCEIYEVPSARPAYRFDETISWISRGAEWCASGWDKIRGMPEVRIWRRDRPQQWVVLRGGFWEPSTAEFSPDGQRIAWGSADGTVYVAAMADVFGRLEQLGLGWR